MVEIPDDVAKQMAAAWRAYAEGDVIQTRSEVHAWADLLDPQPPTLREQVAKEIGVIVRNAMPTLTHDAPGWDAEQADILLAVVADWLAAQPLHPGADGMVCRNQRDHDVRLLRGGSDV